MDQIVDGVLKFQEEVFPEYKALFGELAYNQNPAALFITCSDSRVDPNLITQSKPGDLFICRNAGNMIPPHSHATGGMTASIEYAVAVLGVKHIIICGHTDCGAMKGALNMDSLNALPHVKKWLDHARPAIEAVEAQGITANESQLQRVIEENVLLQAANLATHPAVATKLASGELTLHAWVYKIQTGEICCSNTEDRSYQPLASYYKRTE